MAGRRASFPGSAGAQSADSSRLDVRGSVNVTEENSNSPETEREIVAQYSYGRQLGRIIDVLSELIERWPGGVPADRAVQQFAELRDNIGKIKAQGIARAIAELAELKQSNPAEYARLAPKLRQVLEPDPDNHTEQPRR